MSSSFHSLTLKRYCLHVILLNSTSFSKSECLMFNIMNTILYFRIKVAYKQIPNYLSKHGQ